MKRPLFVLLMTVSILSNINCSGQSQEKLYSLFLLNFAKGIHWPEVMEKDFTIGVFEYPPLIPELISTTTNSNIHGKRIRIIEVHDPADIAHCQIVFIPAYKARALAKVESVVGLKPVLIVTNKLDQVLQGSGIDLVLREGKLTFDINCKSIEARGMKISTNVRSTGRNVF